MYYENILYQKWVRRVAHFIEYKLILDTVSTGTNSVLPLPSLTPLKKLESLTSGFFSIFWVYVLKSVTGGDYNPAGLVTGKVSKGFIGFGHLVSVLLFLNGITFVVVSGD